MGVECVWSVCGVCVECVCVWSVCGVCVECVLSVRRMSIKSEGEHTWVC